MKLQALIATVAGAAALGFVAASAPASEGDRAAPAQLQPHQREADSREHRYCPRGDEDGYDANDLRGRTMPTARRVARAEGCQLRVVKRDGKWRAVTADFVPNRINVVVRDDRVKRVHGVY